MATGNEVWLAYTYPDYAKHAPKEAPRLPEDWDPSDDGTVDDWLEKFDAYAKKLGKALEQAWLKAAEDVRWGKPSREKKSLGRLVSYTAATSAGVREFYPFSLGRQVGGEMGYDFPDVPIGVSLSGRYQPTFLDYNDPHGTLPIPLVIWTAEMEAMIKHASRRIVEALPWMSAAQVMVLEIHY